jgi:uncharacterized protein YndB with AHSA1/START domain
MINLYMSTTIYKPVQQVFDFVSEPENDFQWQYATLETARLSEGVNNSGTFFRSIGHLMGRRNMSTFEVTEYEPNKKYSFRSLSGPLHSQTSYSFETFKSCTKINISMQANVIDFFQMDESLVERYLKRQLKENLAMLKGLLETKRTLLASEPGSFATAR